MKVAVLQSNYLPWKGYFDLINDVDLFVFYDEVQYTKNDWRNRNLIYSKQGKSWITVPVSYKFGQTIIDTKIQNKIDWKKDNWNKLINAYSKAPYWRNYSDFFYSAYFEHDWNYLYELNRFFIINICKEFLKIKTKFADSREYSSEGQKGEKLLSLLSSIGIKNYISGPAAKNYISEDEFSARGFNVTWKDYSGYKEYKQISTPFLHQVSIVDLIFNLGPNASKFIFEKI